MRGHPGWFRVILLAVFAAPCLSQSPSLGVPASNGSPVATLKASSQLVIVDVVVTDTVHRPVHGLTAADFTLTENGAPQTVKNFEEHAALAPADATHVQPLPPLPPGTFTNYSPASTSGAVNILLLDTLNTPLRDQAYVRQQLLAYLKQVPPATRIAIFGLTDRLILLQGFTSDPVVLRTLLEKSQGNASVLLDDQVGGGGVQNSTADNLADWGADPVMVADVRQFEAQQQSFQLQQRAKLTLDAFNQLARYLSIIPGRKNLIWFSGSFPINILPDTTGTLPNPFAVVASSEDEFRQTVDLLGRSQVAVYPVDARGLTSSPVLDVTTTRNYTGAAGIARMNQDQNAFFNDTASEHGTMNAMAAATGGHAFLNTNDLTHAVADAIDQGSNFYTIAYSPANPTADGKLRKIKLQTGRPGLTLAYRQGYYADPPDKVITTQVESASASGAPGQANTSSARDTLRLAMTRGAPTPTDILIKASVSPISPADHPEDQPAPRNTPTVQARGPWRRYSVNLQVDPADLIFFHGPDGKIHAAFEMIVFVYSPEGELLNSATDTVQFVGTLDQARPLFQQGILSHIEVSAPARGQSFLRIAVHDLHRDHYGAVEVATSQVSHVIASPPPASPAAK